MKEFVIDLFCGAGGTSTGVHLAKCNSRVTACVNHDRKAIESHRINHPGAKHFIEDIRNPEVVFFLKLRVDALRKLYPGCIITIWASLECTNFSKAKGGLPRDADSRTLAEHLFIYLEALAPDYLMIENVIEFMAWGPLDDKGKPVSKRRGIDYLKWIENVKSYGYDFDWKELNSANFGAYTSRCRYFAQFAKRGLPISWPEATHSKKPSSKGGMFGEPLKKWKPVKEVLNLENEGNSIFDRKKPLVENTLKRIYAGLVKFVANGDDPCPTVAAQSRLGIMNTTFLHSYYGNGNAHSENEPCPTVTTKDRFGVISPQFLVNSYSGGGKISDLKNPAPSVTGVPKSNLTSCLFIDQQFGKSKPSSVDSPLGAITQNPKYAYVKAERFLFNPQYKNPGNSVEKPCPVIIARQDKKPLSLVHCEKGEGFVVPVYEDDNETMIKIKQFMAYFGIVDIKMRMLEVVELLKIQGFPAGYQLVGNKTEQKKFIGNSVEVTTAKALFEAHHGALVDYFKKLAA